VMRWRPKWWSDIFVTGVRKTKAMELFFWTGLVYKSLVEDGGDVEDGERMKNCRGLLDAGYKITGREIQTNIAVMGAYS
jgi:hypothetical protein